jgi:hypothetical protein
LPTATVGGTVTSDHASAAQGDVVTLTATPAQGYKLTVNGLTVIGATESVPVTATASQNAYTFIMPNSNVTVSAVFAEHTVTADPAMIHGTLIFSPASPKTGDRVTVTAVAEDGFKALPGTYMYTVYGGEYDNVKFVPNSYFLDNKQSFFTMPDGDIVFSAQFALVDTPDSEQYTLTPAAVDHVMKVIFTIDHFSKTYTTPTQITPGAMINTITLSGIDVGYQTADLWSYSDGENTYQVRLTTGLNQGAFYMPASNITLTGVVETNDNRYEIRQVDSTGNDNLSYAYPMLNGHLETYLDTDRDTHLDKEIDTPTTTVAFGDHLIFTAVPDDGFMFAPGSVKYRFGTLSGIYSLEPDADGLFMLPITYAYSAHTHRVV